MRVPRVKFDESNVGLVPVREGIRNRIGIVGEFSRGPANVASFILGYTDFANRYGSDTKKGSLAFQSAWDQGAEDFSLVRVLGRAKTAKGSIIFSNASTRQNTLFLHLKFVGEPVNLTATPLVTPVSTSGTYTGTVTGRYYLRVTALNASSATVKYVFAPLGTEASIDWASISTTITVGLTADKGVAKPIANGVNVHFGTVGQGSNIQLRVGDEISIRVNSHTFQIPISNEDLPNQIANLMVERLSGVEPIGEISVNDEDNGVIFALDEALAGSIGNRYCYYAELQTQTGAGVSFTANNSASPVYMNGGVDGPRFAFRDFYTLSGIPLLRLIANSEGAWGNQLRISLYPVNQRQFRLHIEDLNSANFNPSLAPETYLIDFSSLDEVGYISALNSSKFVRGVFLPKFNNPNNFNINLTQQSPQRLAPANQAVVDPEDPAHPNFYGPSKLSGVSLEGGYDGPEITEEDYIRGLQVLGAEPVHIVMAAGVYDSPAIKASLISHAENSAELEGLRIAVLNARPGTNPASARQETLGFNSNRAVMVAGWCSYAGQPNSARFGLSPDGIYAGKLAATPFFAGPNAPRTAGVIQGITECDTRTFASLQALQLMTESRLEVLTLDPATQAYKFVNGRTLASDTSWEKVSIRRTYDVIRMDLYDLLQQFVGEPHTNLLRVQIVSAINAYMQEKLREGMIANFRPSQADNSNNSPENYINGELNIRLAFLPLYSADYINISMVRDSGTGLVSFSV